MKAYVLGALLVASVLKTKNQSKSNSTTNFLNFEESNFDYQMSCGANNCPQTKLKGSMSIPTDGSKSLFYSILTGLILTAVLVTYFFIDDLELEIIEKNNKITLSNIRKFNQNLYYIFIRRHYTFNFGSMNRFYNAIFIFFPMFFGYSLCYINKYL